jgi:phosphopantothenoylcysteine decarboxylase/phosphopantothenate--cysteine ligase
VTAGRRILLGVGASVAIHRALDLVSTWRKEGHLVDCLLTPAATRLVAPIQFAALAGRRALHDLFEAPGDDVYDHLAPARAAELLIICPATADLIARLAHGMADDLVTTSALAFQGPRVFCPAMNWRMWQNPVVRRNAGLLVQGGWRQVGPASGDLACGEEGPGRLAPLDEIEAAVREALGAPGPGPAR